MTTDQRPLALLHTSPVLVPTFTQLAAELLPERPIFHLVDESLIKNTIAAGHLTTLTARRVLGHVESAAQAGAGAVLVTCSSIGEAVAASRFFVDVPVFRIDEAMAEQAVARATRIGVAATLSTTLQPTLTLLQQTAQAQGKTVELVPTLCEGAFAAVLAGQTETHDALVSQALQSLLGQVELVVLAQASMARVLGAVNAGGKPILASPRLAMERLQNHYAQLEVSR